MLSTRTTHRFSVGQYDRMVQVGILTKNSRAELIRGEILTKATINPLPASVVRRLNHFFSLNANSVLVGIQNPVGLADSEPEPDLILLKPRDDYYASGKPTPADVLLVIEVADSSIDFEREVMLPLYAENGVVEYWIVNLVETTLEVYRQPQPDGSYSHSKVFGIGDTFSPACLPSLVMQFADVFGQS